MLDIYTRFLTVRSVFVTHIQNTSGYLEKKIMDNFDFLFHQTDQYTKMHNIANRSSVNALVRVTELHKS